MTWPISKVMHCPEIGLAQLVQTVIQVHLGLVGTRKISQHQWI
ncbi:hypothetical protein [Polynucleobacter asymbioticus]|nr:hypothetical protein [Polynucleobacter asymbioticus]